jgi:hypothetical protein
MRRVPTQLEVYGPDTNYKSTPDDVISYEDGRLRVENGQADFVKHGKAIRLRSPRNAEPSRHRRIEENEQRGYSCQPGTGLDGSGRQESVSGAERVAESARVNSFSAH